MNYNKQYYILFGDFSDGPSYLRALKKTSKRNFEYEKLSRTGGPAFFENAFDEEDKEDGQKHPIYDVMSVAGWFLFSQRIYEKMREFNTRGMQLFPAVFIDDDGHYHENYMLTNFYEKLDCLDLERSNILGKLQSSIERYDVENFYLSQSILDDIPEDERLIFKIDKSFDANIFVHQRLKDIIEQSGATGASFIRVDEYTSGDEYDDDDF